MKRYKNRTSLAYLIIGAAILVFMLGSDLTEGTPSSGNIAQYDLSQTTTKPLRIDNKTSAFEVVDVERLERHRVRLTLKNNSGKAITAFALSLGDYSIEPDLFPEMLAPGQTHMETFTLPPVTGQENVIELLCVIFDDQTSEGNSSVVNRIKESRLGSILAATSMHAHLQRILNASDQALLPTLREAKLAIFSLSRPQRAQSSFHVKAGYNSARENVLIDLGELESESQAGCDIPCLRRRLLNIEQREYRKVISSRR